MSGLTFFHAGELAQNKWWQMSNIIDAWPKLLHSLSWPTLDEIQKLQKDLDKAPTDGCEEQNGLLMFKGRVWIPPLDYIRSALMVIAHYGFSGHASIANTMGNLKAFCHWRFDL